MHRQLWGYKVEGKLYVGVREQKRLYTAVLADSYEMSGVNIRRLIRKRNGSPLEVYFMSLDVTPLTVSLASTTHSLTCLNHSQSHLPQPLTVSLASITHSLTCLNHSQPQSHCPHCCQHRAVSSQFICQTGCRLALQVDYDSIPDETSSIVATQKPWLNWTSVLWRRIKEGEGGGLQKKLKTWKNWNKRSMEAFRRFCMICGELWNTFKSDSVFFCCWKCRWLYGVLSCVALIGGGGEKYRYKNTLSLISHFWYL
jgi:hypothetical protein